MTEDVAVVRQGPASRTPRRVLIGLAVVLVLGGVTNYIRIQHARPRPPGPVTFSGRTSNESGLRNFTNRTLAVLANGDESQLAQLGQSTPGVLAKYRTGAQGPIRVEFAEPALTTDDEFGSIRFQRTGQTASIFVHRDGHRWSLSSLR